MPCGKRYEQMAFKSLNVFIAYVASPQVCRLAQTRAVESARSRRLNARFRVLDDQTGFRLHPDEFRRHLENLRIAGLLRVMFGFPSEIASK